MGSHPISIKLPSCRSSIYRTPPRVRKNSLKSTMRRNGACSSTRELPTKSKPTFLENNTRGTCLESPAESTSRVFLCPTACVFFWTKIPVATDQSEKENDAAAQSEDASLALTLLLFTLSLSRKESKSLKD